MKRKLILFASAAFLVSIKGDGRFPVPGGLSETAFQLILLPYTLLFVWIIWKYFNSSSSLERSPLSLIRIVSIVCFVFTLMIVMLYVWQERKYSLFGYDLNAAYPVGTLVLSASLLAFIYFRGRSSMHLLLTSFLLLAVTYTISILHFPLHPGRSDMLLLIRAAGEQFLSGANPYIEYSLPHRVPLTYLPIAWMTYLPAVYFNFDLRVIHLIAILASFVLVAAALKTEVRDVMFLFASLFLMMPYLHYRHEVYTGIFWLVLSLFFYFNQKKNPLLASILIGVSVGVSQFAWILAPVMLLAIGRMYGLKVFAYSVTITLVVASAIILPFYVMSPEFFYHGIIGRWAGNLNATTFNFSFFLAKAFSVHSLVYFQLIFVVVIYGIAAADSKLPERMYQYMAYALAGFILLNALIWVYFYLVLFLLMIFHVASVPTLQPNNATATGRNQTHSTQSYQ